MNNHARNRVWLAVVVSMAVALHLQATLEIGEGGHVRFALSDAVGLLVSPIVIWLAWVNRGVWNRRETWIALYLAAAGSAVMTLGLVRAGLSTQGISNWAIVKYVGWYVLIGYGMLGTLVGTIAPKPAIEWCVRVFVLVHALLVVTFIGFSVAGLGWPTPEFPRFTGLAENPNAYALSLLCGLSLLLGVGEPVFRRIPSYGFELLCAVICAGVLFTRSLAGFAGLVVVAGIFLITVRDFVRVVRVALITLVLYAIPWAGNVLVQWAGMPVGDLHAGIGSKLSNPDKYAFSISARLESNGRAMALWNEAPVLGAGLGVFYEREKASASTTRPALQVHNTFLWILAELGLIGALVFGAMFLAALFVLLRAWRSLDRDSAPAAYVAAGLMIAGTWATMSMAHELMYQRLPWFLLGVCLAAGLLARSGANLRK